MTIRFDDLIWRIMYEARCSLSDVGRAMDCSQPTMWRLMNNKTDKLAYATAINLLALAKKYNIEVDFTLDDILYSGKNRKGRTKNGKPERKTITDEK